MFAKESQKIKVAVLYGGRSGEHEVSLRSAASIIKNLDENKFEVVLVGINKQGQCWLNDFSEWPITESLSVVFNSSQKLSFEGLREQCDVVFPVLHGAFGEDGTVQGLLEFIDLPYVGANVLGSAIGMDKDVAKRLASADSIPVVPFIAFNTGQWENKKGAYQQEIQEKLGYPLFIKPVSTGSSLGITKVKKPTELLSAIQRAFKYDTKVLIEKALEVREIEVAVLENLDFGKEPFISVPGEIIPRLSHHEFYSYEAKYIDEEGAALVIPAILEEGQFVALKTLAGRIFECLDCEGMARVDFFIEKNTKKIYFNEINTIPGFTQISMYPKLWNASGRSYKQLLTDLINLSLIRYKRSYQLRSSLCN